MNVAHVIFNLISTSRKLYAVSICLLCVLLISQLSSRAGDFKTKPTTTTLVNTTTQPGFFTNKYVYTKPSQYFRDGVTVPQLDITLLKTTGSALFIPTDSVRLNFEDFYNNNIDTADVIKTVFTASNLSILKYGVALSAEKRTKLLVTDSIFLKLGNLQTTGYRLAIDPSVLANPQLQAFVKDNYLQTETPISLNAVANIDFTVTADAASAAGNRFYIFFRPYVVAGALPVTFIFMQAAINENKTIAVRWKVAIELNLLHYETETSIDGITFTKFGSNVFSTGNGNAASYERTDAVPVRDLLYYRIKAISTTGQVAYSNIARLKINDKYQPIQVNPNPVANKTLNIVFNDRAGLYSYIIVNQQGKTVGSGQLKVGKNLQQKTILLNAGLAVGRHELLLINDNGVRINIAIMLL